MKYEKLNKVESQDRVVFKTGLPAVEVKEKQRYKNLYFKQFSLVIVCFLFLGGFAVFGGTAAQKTYTTIKTAITKEQGLNTFGFLERFSYFSFLSQKNEAEEVAAPMGSVQYPVWAENYRIVNGQIEFLNCNEVFVRAVADGVIKAIHENAGVKTIEISHSGKVVSKYSNMAVAGVLVGQKVYQGDILGSINEGGSLIFSISYKGKLVPLHFLEDGKINIGI